MRALRPSWNAQQHEPSDESLDDVLCLARGARLGELLTHLGTPQRLTV